MLNILYVREKWNVICTLSVTTSLCISYWVLFRVHSVHKWQRNSCKTILKWFFYFICICSNMMIRLLSGSLLGQLQPIHITISILKVCQLMRYVEPLFQIKLLNCLFYKSNMCLEWSPHSTTNQWWLESRQSLKNR